MQNCPMNSIEEYDDISTYGEYQIAVSAGLTNEEALKLCYLNSRDNARTPVQWDDTENAGFTVGTPWLKVNPNYKEINVKKQLTDEDSVLSYYRKLLALRKSEEWKEVFTYGKFIPLFEAEDNIFAYERKLDNKSAIVIANFNREEKTLQFDNMANRSVLLNNMKNVQVNDNQITLQPCQVIVTG